MNSTWTALLPVICVALFAFTAWLVLELCAYFLRPGSTKQMMFPGMPDDMVTRRKRLLSLYEIYSPGDTKADLKNESRRGSMSRPKMVSVFPSVATINEKCEDLPPAYGQLVLTVENLPSENLSSSHPSPPPPQYQHIHKDVGPQATP